MNRTSGHVIAREDNVVHVDFERDPRFPRPPFSGAAALRAKSPSSPDASFDYKPLVGQAVRRTGAQG